MVGAGVTIIVVAGPAIGAGAAFGATAFCVGGAVVGAFGAAETLINANSEETVETPISTPGAMGANLINKAVNKNDNKVIEHGLKTGGIITDSLLTGGAGALSEVSTAVDGCIEINEASEDILDYMKQQPEEKNK